MGLLPRSMDTKKKRKVSTIARQVAFLDTHDPMGDWTDAFGS